MSEPPGGGGKDDRGEGEQDTDLGKNAAEVAAVLEQLGEGVVGPGVWSDVGDGASGAWEDFEWCHGAAECGQAEAEQEGDGAGLLFVAEQAPDEDGEAGADEAEGKHNGAGPDLPLPESTTRLRQRTHEPCQA